MSTEELIRWFAATNGIIAAIAVPGNLGRSATGIGFIILTLPSIGWIAAGYLEDMSGLDCSERGADGHQRYRHLPLLHRQRRAVIRQKG